MPATDIVHNGTLYTGCPLHDKPELSTAGNSHHPTFAHASPPPLTYTETLEHVHGLQDSFLS